MNVLIMSKIFAKSGVGSHIMDLSEMLVERGNTVSIMSGTNDHEDFCKEKDISFVHVDFSMDPKLFFKSVGKIKNYIREHHIDIVHCHHRTCGFFMNIISKLTGVPFVWSNHLDNIPSDFIHRRTTFYGKQAICVSTELKNFCMDKLKIPKDKISVIYNGIHPENYQYDEAYVKRFYADHELGDKKVIGLLARMSPIKGHQHLVNALSIIPTLKLENYVVVFFGGGMEDEYTRGLKENIRSKGLEKYFIFEGFVKPNQALSLSDITVLPSENEGFGICSIESFQMKRPHIRTKTAGYCDMDDCCIGVEIGDEEALAKEIEHYLDGADYSKMIQYAYETVQKKFTAEVMTDQIIRIYKNAVKG